MSLQEALWKVFERTGNVGAYLLYKDYEREDASQQELIGQLKKVVGSGDSSNK